MLLSMTAKKCFNASLTNVWTRFIKVKHDKNTGTGPNVTNTNRCKGTTWWRWLICMELAYQQSSVNEKMSDLRDCIHTRQQFGIEVCNLLWLLIGPGHCYSSFIPWYQDEKLGIGFWLANKPKPALATSKWWIWDIKSFCMIDELTTSRHLLNVQENIIQSRELTRNGTFLLVVTGRIWVLVKFCVLQ